MGQGKNKKIMGVCIIILCLWLGAGTARAAAPWEGTVLDVRDGDSVLIAPLNTTGKRKRPVTVRLYGVDAPELGQNYGHEAHHWLLDHLARGTRVEVTPYATDKYKRVVGVIRRNGADVNAVMVAEGMAWVYGRYCKKAFCKDWKKTEKLARQSKKGLWRHENPQRPERWRHQNPR